jgi:hypothetical protein
MKMFNFGRVRKLEKQVYELEHEVQRLEQELTDLDVETENRVALENNLNQSNVTIDWEVMNAFSIERNKGNIEDLGLRAYTTIGYFVPGAEGEAAVREWHLWTSVEQHNKLVEDFNAYIAKKKKK